MSILIFILFFVLLIALVIGGAIGRVDDLDLIEPEDFNDE